MKISKSARGRVAFAGVVVAVVVGSNSAAQGPPIKAPSAGVARVNKHMGIGLLTTAPNPPKPKTAIAFDCAKPTAEMCRQPDYYTSCPDQRKEKSFCFDTITKLGEAQYKAAEAKGQVRTILYPGATITGDKIPGAVTAPDHTKDTYTGGTHSFTSLAMRPKSAAFAPLVAAQLAYKVNKKSKPIDSCEDYIEQKYFSFNEFEEALVKAGGSARAFVDLAFSAKWEAVAKGTVISLDGKPAASRTLMSKDQSGWSQTGWNGDLDNHGTDVGPNGFREYAPELPVPGTPLSAMYDYPLVDANHQPVEFQAILSLAAGLSKKTDLSWDKQKELSPKFSKLYLDEELAMRYQKAIEYRTLAQQRENIWWEWNSNVNKCVDSDEPRPEIDYDSKTLIADMEAVRNAAVKQCVTYRNKSAQHKKAGNAANVTYCESKTLPALRWKITRAKTGEGGIEKVRSMLEGEWKNESKEATATWKEYDTVRRAQCKAIGFEGLIHDYWADDHYKNIRNLPATYPKKVQWVREVIAKPANLAVVTKVLEQTHKKLRAIDSQLLELQKQGQALGCYDASATNACNWAPQFFAENFKHVRHWLYVERDRDFQQCNAFTNKPGKKALTWKKSVSDILGGNDAKRAAAWKKTLVNIKSFEKYFEDAEDYTREFKKEAAKYTHHLQATDDKGKKALGNGWNDDWSGGNEYFGASYDVGASWRVAGVGTGDNQCATNAKVQAKLNVKAKALGYNIEIADAELSAETLEKSAKVHAHARVVGNGDLFKPYNEKVALAHTFAFNKTFADAFDYSATARFPIGPIAITVGGGISGKLGVNLEFRPTIERQCGGGSPAVLGNLKLSADARVEPYAELDAHAEVGVDFWIGEVGIRGNLLLVRVGLPLDADASFQYRDTKSLTQLRDQKYNVSPDLPGYYIDAKAKLGFEVETLDGSVDLYLKLGWGWFSKTWNWEIASWQGYGYETTLFQKNLVVNMSALVQALND